MNPIYAMNVGTSQMVLLTFLSYLVSFLFVAIYWVIHHHLFQTVRAVDAEILWYDMNLLFWLSLFP